MKCPKCNNEMQVEIPEHEAKLKTNEIFIRTVYHCVGCNIFVGVYLPLEK